MQRFDQQFHLDFYQDQGQSRQACEHNLVLEETGERALGAFSPTRSIIVYCVSIDAPIVSLELYFSRSQMLDDDSFDNVRFYRKILGKKLNIQN